MVRGEKEENGRRHRDSHLKASFVFLKIKTAHLLRGRDRGLGEAEAEGRRAVRGLRAGKGAIARKRIASWLKQAHPLGSPGAGRGGDPRGHLPTWVSFLG